MGIFQAGQIVWDRDHRTRLRVEAAVGSKVWLHDEHGRDFVWPTEFVTETDPTGNVHDPVFTVVRSPYLETRAPVQKPKRKYEFELHLSADTEDELKRSLAHIEYEFASGGLHGGFASGGVSSGFWGGLAVRPEQTPENYQVELSAYLELTRAQRR